MRISSEEEGLGCQSVYRVIGVLNGDAGFYLNDSDHNYSEGDFQFDSVLTGSGALAIHADRRGVPYETDTKDIDLYANSEIADLEAFKQFPHTEESRRDGSQLCYDTTSASTSLEAPEAFVDVITDYGKAFEWDEDEAGEVHRLLEEEAGGDDPIATGAITVHLPSLDTLRKTFEYSNLDYSDRIDMIDDMQSGKPKPVVAVED